MKAFLWFLPYLPHLPPYPCRKKEFLIEMQSKGKLPTPVTEASERRVSAPCGMRIPLSPICTVAARQHASASSCTIVGGLPFLRPGPARALTPGRWAPRAPQPYYPVPASPPSLPYVHHPCLFPTNVLDRCQWHIWSHLDPCTTCSGPRCKLPHLSMMTPCL